MPFFRIRKATRRRNYIKNPTAGGPRGYSGTNATVTRTALKSHSGRYAYLVAPTAATGTLNLELGAFPNSPGVWTFWATGGEPVQVEVGSAVARAWPVEWEGEWTRYEVVLAASQVSGATSGSVRVNRTTYLDDLQFEPGLVRTTALNGSMGPGYTWLAAQHYSVSERQAVYRRRLVTSGGIEKAFDDDERVRVLIAHGIGVPPIKARTVEVEGRDGEIVLDRTLQPQAIRLSIFLVEEDVDALLRLRYDLIDLIAPGDEVMLLTDLGGEPQWIRAAYQSGLELDEVIVGAEKLTLNLMASQPGWTSLVQQSFALTLSAALSVNYACLRQFGQWSNAAGGPGAPVRRIEVGADGTTYVCTLASGGYGYVKEWTGDSWNALARANGDIYDAKRSLDGGKLYLVGTFTQISKADGTGLVSANRIAVLDLSTLAFSALGTGLNGPGYKLWWNPDGSVLYVGGSFSQAGGVAAANIAALTIAGSVWAALGSGLDGACWALAGDNTGAMYVGGAFGAAGAVAGGVTGLTGTDAGTGAHQGWVRIYYVTALDGSNNETARSASYAPDVMWKGTNLSWNAVAGAAKYRLYWLTQLGWSKVGETASTSYSHTTGFPSDGLQPPTLSSTNGTIATPRIAKWTPATGLWSAVGQSGFDSTVYDLWLDPADQLTLLAAGDFRTADGVQVNRVAWYNGTLWRGFGSVGANDTLYAVRRLADGSVIVAGKATSIGGDSLALGLGRWVGAPSSGAWLHTDLKLPTGVSVYAVAELGEGWLVGHSASGTATVAGVTSLTWPGNTAGYPRLIVDGPGQLYGCEVFEAGAGLWLDGYTLADGETLTFDMAPDAKTLVSSVQGNLTHRIRPGSPYGDVQLVPGDNTVSLLMTGTTAASSARLIGYTRYLSVDRP